MKYNTKRMSYQTMMLLFLIACNTATTTVADKDTIAVKLTDNITLVKTDTVQWRSLDYIINANGKVKSSHEQLFFSETAGRILAFEARAGKLYAANEKIFSLETTIIQYRLEKAKLARFNGEKEYESQLLGYENLLKGKSQEQAEDIRKKLRISTGLSIAEQEIKEAEYELTRTIIKAPFTGILADIKVASGQQLKVGEPLFRIYNPYELLLEIKVLEADIPLLKIGTPATVTPVSDAAIKFTGQVNEINPYVDENGMVAVKLTIKTNGLPGQSPLFPGMNCIANIHVPLLHSLIVPKDAIVIRNRKSVIFTLEKERAKWHYVITGRDNGKEVEIREGLKKDERVIVTNNLQLADDAPVKEDDPSIHDTAR